jgi:hypothetical protein
MGEHVARKWGSGEVGAREINALYWILKAKGPEKYVIPRVVESFQCAPRSL